LSVAGKTSINHDFGEARGTKLELSRDKVELKTFAPLSISSTNDSTIAGHNIELNAHNLSINLEDGDDDLFVNGESLKTKLDKKLGIDLARELSSKLALSDDISWELSDYNNSAKFLLSSDISCGYVKAENKIRLVVQDSNIDIDVADLFANKIIKKAWVEKTEDGTFLYIEFDIDGDPSTEDSKIIKIKIDEFFRPYKAGYGISVDNELGINISKEFDDQVQAIQGYVNELSGPVGPYIGIIPTLSNAIDSLITNEAQELMFGGLIELDTADPSIHYPTVGAFLSTELGGSDVVTTVRNNSYFDVKFFHGLQLSSVITTDDGLSVGDGDQIIIYEHSPSEDEEIKRIAWEDLHLIDEHAAGNVYVIKAGVSRYEFEAEAKKRGDDDAFISAWIERNFANTEAESYALTTTLKQAVSADGNLSVANDAFVLNDLSVAG